MEAFSIKISKLERKEFKEVLRKGKGIKENSLVAKIFRDPKEKKIKIGVLVSKKVLKKAVERNKLKRRLKEIVRKEKVKEGTKIVFIPLFGINLEFKNLKEKVEKILKRAKVSK